MSFEIYKYIPELSKDKIQNIIRKKEEEINEDYNIIATYAKYVITDYGLDVDEIRFIKTTNYRGPGACITNFSIGLYEDIRCEVDSCTVNGKPCNYQINDDFIDFEDAKCYNNQYIEMESQEDELSKSSKSSKE